MIDYLNNVESEYRGIRRTLRTAAAKNHVILRHLYRFLPEESDKLGCHAGVIQVTLSLTHDNSYVVDWRISIFRVADPNLGYKLNDVLGSGSASTCTCESVSKAPILE